MPEVSCNDGLELTRDPRHHRMQWRAERLFWLMIALVLLAAVAGLVGHGPLSADMAGEPGGRLWVEYFCLERHQGPTDLRVFFGPDAGRDGEVHLWIDRGFISAIEITGISPPPGRVEAESDRYTYVFHVPRAGEVTSVILHYEPNAYGTVNGRMGVGEGASVEFTQFVFP